MFLFRPGNLIKITRETFIEAFESQNNSDDLHKHPKDAREAGYFKINTGKAQTKQLGGGPD